MEPWLLKHSALLYQGAMVAGFLAIAAWETMQPRRSLVLSTARRWLVHGSFVVLTRAAIWLAFPVSAVGISIAVAGSRYGLLNRGELPFPIRFVLTFLLLDLVLYFQHYLLHKVPLLWRFHRMHHSDREYDLTTGIRFHPLESLYLQGVTLLAIALTAPPISAVICFELVNVVQTFFGHANVRLPARIERVMRLVHVTPEIHRVHHSLERSDHNTNFGAIFTFWDRLFGTLRNEPRLGEAQFQFGLQEVSAMQSVRLWDMLALPFHSESRPAESAAASGSHQGPDVSKNPPPVGPSGARSARRTGSAAPSSSA